MLQNFLKSFVKKAPEIVYMNSYINLLALGQTTSLPLFLVKKDKNSIKNGRKKAKDLYINAPWLYTS